MSAADVMTPDPVCISPDAALAFTNHWMSTDRLAFAGDHLSASFNAQSYGGAGGKRLSVRDVLRRPHALRGDPVANVPHAFLQRDRSQRRWLRAGLQLAQRDRYAQ